MGGPKLDQLVGNFPRNLNSLTSEATQKIIFLGSWLLGPRADLLARLCLQLFTEELKPPVFLHCYAVASCIS